MKAASRQPASAGKRKEESRIVAQMHRSLDGTDRWVRDNIRTTAGIAVTLTRFIRARMCSHAVSKTNMFAYITAHLFTQQLAEPRKQEFQLIQMRSPPTPSLV